MIAQLKVVAGKLAPDAATELMLRQVRLDCYNYHPTELADSIGVSAATIYSFRSGRTKWPRPNTLFPILDFLGYKIAITKV